MKPKFLFLILFIVISLKSFSQTKNIIDFQYGVFADKLILPPRSVGGGDLKGNGGSLFGIKYTRRLNSFLSVSSGLQLSNDEIREGGTVPPYDKETIKLITIPAYINVNFLKYLFIDGGLNFDFQTNKNFERNPQTGVGMELGAGVKYNFGQIEIFANPFVAIHSFTADQRRLTNDGYKFGIGYCF